MRTNSDRNVLIADEKEFVTHQPAGQVPIAFIHKDGGKLTV
jgi:hypothetical protein